MRPMNVTELRNALKSKAVNLSELARKSKVNVRTLRRIKSGKTKDVLSSTIEAIEKGLWK